MPNPIQTRLNLTDIKTMLNAHAQLEAVIQALRTTNWAGARTAIAALAPVDQWIVDLYNRAEPYWLHYLETGKAGRKVIAPLENSGDSAAESPATLREPEPGE
jgi:hypothetical protein